MSAEDRSLAIREILAGLAQLRTQEQRFSEGGLGNENAVAVLEQLRLRREAMERRVERLLQDSAQATGQSRQSDG